MQRHIQPTTCESTPSRISRLHHHSQFGAEALARSRHQKAFIPTPQAHNRNHHIGHKTCNQNQDAFAVVEGDSPQMVAHTEQQGRPYAVDTLQQTKRNMRKLVGLFPATKGYFSVLDISKYQARLSRSLCIRRHVCCILPTGCSRVVTASSPCSQSCSALHWAAEPEKWQLLLLGGSYPSLGLIWILEAIHQQRNILEQIISKFWDVLTEQLIIRFLQVQRSGILWPRKSSLSCTKPSQSRVLGQRAAAAPAAVVPFKLLSNILKLSKQLCNLAPKSTRISPGMFNQKAQRIQPRSSRPTQTQSSQSTDLL